MNARTYWGAKPPNLMTPDRVAFIDRPDGRLVEVTTGTGMNDEPIWGVSVADGTPPRFNQELSRLFWNKDEALAYANAETMAPPAPEGGSK